MPFLNPHEVRLSRHFLLSDFLGCHTAYTRGMPNMLRQDDPQLPLKLANARALCEHILEPLVEVHGPMSISYGYISSALSRAIVTYQDPDKPSHHMWNLGAGADVCIHNWVDKDRGNDDVETAPIFLAHCINTMGVPYSRLITYSESPYICLAASAEEIRADSPRKAFYENRYTGVAKAKPEYKSYSTDGARLRAFQGLAGRLPNGWRGQGYPSYHGGGRRQYHHLRVSKYCMLSDFLFDLQSMSNGAKNIPSLRNPDLWNVFCAAGEAYDLLIDTLEIKRASIIAGYVSHTNLYLDPDSDWRNGYAYFSVILPEGTDPDFMGKLVKAKYPHQVVHDSSDWEDTLHFKVAV